ncbi:hypothetical protein [Streptacidiphilus fuscans]|uniref:Small secreted protein n=1 Tax=Streptacidiphilus fuscans TaxID=2789292 RepID=A0A931B3N1_9ACTN|nr:hypothetical protein [Streptacidiphilus fuscans]MBF9070615.1 hypothetical protein [Streptacidiphilus fuscans]
MVALGAAACTSSDNSAQLDSWAKSVCGGISAPIQEVQAAQADTGKIIPGESPSALQTRLADDLGKLAAGNQQIAQAVQAAGAPQTSDGTQTQASAVSELNETAGGYTKVQATVKELSVDDQAKFAAALKGVSDQVQQLSTQSTTALQKLQSGQLGAALGKQPACAAPSGTPTAESTGASTGATTSGSPQPKASGSASDKASPSGSSSAGGSSSGSSSSGGGSSSGGSSSGSGSPDASSSAG